MITYNKLSEIDRIFNHEYDAFLGVMWLINAWSKVKIHNHLCDKTQFVGTMIMRDEILKITGNGTKSDHTECYLDTNELSTILMIPVAQ